MPPEKIVLLFVIVRVQSQSKGGLTRLDPCGPKYLGVSNLQLAVPRQAGTAPRRPVSGPRRRTAAGVPRQSAGKIGAPLRRRRGTGPQGVLLRTLVPVRASGSRAAPHRARRRMHGRMLRSPSCSLHECAGARGWQARQAVGEARRAADLGCNGPRPSGRFRLLSQATSDVKPMHRFNGQGE